MLEFTQQCILEIISLIKVREWISGAYEVVDEAVGERSIKLCKKCNTEKPLEEFLRAKGEHTYKCLVCNREEGKQRYKNMMSKIYPLLPRQRAGQYDTSTQFKTQAGLPPPPP